MGEFVPGGTWEAEGGYGNPTCRVSTDGSYTGINVDAAGRVDGTNAPYLQLLVCQKDYARWTATPPTRSRRPVRTRVSVTAVADCLGHPSPTITLASSRRTTSPGLCSARHLLLPRPRSVSPPTTARMGVLHTRPEVHHKRPCGA